MEEYSLHAVNMSCTNDPSAPYWVARSGACSGIPVPGFREFAVYTGCAIGYQLSTFLQSFFSEFKGAEDGACFILAFFVFAGGDGVGHDAGSSLQVGGFVFDEHGSDHDAGGEIAGKVEIEHGAAIKATAVPQASNAIPAATAARLRGSSEVARTSFVRSAKSK